MELNDSVLMRQQGARLMKPLPRVGAEQPIAPVQYSVARVDIAEFENLARKQVPGRQCTAEMYRIASQPLVFGASIGTGDDEHASGERQRSGPRPGSTVTMR